MLTFVTRRTGSIAYIEITPSRNNDDMLFISAPPVSELTQEQTQELINTLTFMAEKKWGN